MKPYPVKISPDMYNEICDVLQSLEIQPINVNAPPPSAIVSTIITHNLILKLFYNLFFQLIRFFHKFNAAQRTPTKIFGWPATT